MFNHPSFNGHELVTHHVDESTGLRAIIAVHSSKRGPALGGCRMFEYVDDDQALNDVLRLSQGMSYKTALAGLPLGGGKSVIVGNPHTLKSPDLMQAMGRFVDRLNGRYIAAEDSGTSVADLAEMGRVTEHVAGVNHNHAAGGDPSPSTALGVFLSIEAAVKWRYDKSLHNVTVAVQGAGNVGRHLINHLIQAGASVLVCDVNRDNLDKAIALGATEVGLDQIHRSGALVFAPCAMGAAINDQFIAETDATIIAGAANNQLAHDGIAQKLMFKGILYAPDYLINAGGIIDAYYQTQGLLDQQQINQSVSAIAGRLIQVFESARTQGCSPAMAADQLAEHILRSDS